MKKPFSPAASEDYKRIASSTLPAGNVWGSLGTRLLCMEVHNENYCTNTTVLRLISLSCTVSSSTAGLYLMSVKVNLAYKPEELFLHQSLYC